MFQLNQHPAPLLTGQLTVRFTIFIITVLGATPLVACTHSITALQVSINIFFYHPRCAFLTPQNWQLQYLIAKFCFCLNTDEAWCPCGLVVKVPTMKQGPCFKCSWGNLLFLSFLIFCPFISWQLSPVNSLIDFHLSGKVFTAGPFHPSTWIS